MRLFEMGSSANDDRGHFLYICRCIAGVPVPDAGQYFKALLMATTASRSALPTNASSLSFEIR